MALSMTNFYPCPHQPPNPQILHHKYQFFCLKHTARVLQTCPRNVGTGSSLSKTTFRAKIHAGLGQGSIPKNWDLLVISATIEAINQNRRGPGQKSIQKNQDPLLISATIEASDFKFCTQLGLVEQVAADADGDGEDGDGDGDGDGEDANADGDGEDEDEDGDGEDADGDSDGDDENEHGDGDDDDDDDQVKVAFEKFANFLAVFFGVPCIEQPLRKSDAIISLIFLRQNHVPVLPDSTKRFLKKIIMGRYLTPDTVLRDSRHKQVMK